MILNNEFNCWKSLNQVTMQPELICTLRIASIGRIILRKSSCMRVANAKYMEMRQQIHSVISKQLLVLWRIQDVEKVSNVDILKFKFGKPY